MQNCVLCGKSLALYPTNREHYVPRVLLREFKTLCVNPKFDWALRRNEFSLANTDNISVPLTKHEQWATVIVHEKCNLEAAAMCRDLRYIIDHLDDCINDKYFRRPIEYYSHLWRIKPSDVVFTLLNKDEARSKWSEPKSLLYRPGLLNCGRIVIHSLLAANDYEHHTIYIGTQGVLN